MRADCASGKVQRVTFQNVPAFAVHLDRPIEVPHLGTVTVDVAYGGMFYVIADAAALGLRLTPDEGRDITRVSEMIKAAAQEQLPGVHPEQPGFSGVTIAQLSGPPSRPGRRREERRRRSRPASSTGTGRPPGPARIDRSPCGTGTCAKMATLHAKGRLALESGLSATRAFSAPSSPGAWSRRRSVGPYRAVVPTLSGSGLDHRLREYVVDPEDPFPEGFTVGDIW